MSKHQQQKLIRRMMIIGGPGSGKSTLARRLGELTGLPVVHIDKMYWQPGWQLRSPEATRRLVSEAAEKDAWIFEGNNSSSFSVRANRADTIIFLDMPTLLRLRRVLWRTISNYKGSRPDMADGCLGRFDFDFLKWVVGYKGRGARHKALVLLANTANRACIHHLKSKADVRKFLEDFGPQDKQ